MIGNSFSPLTVSPLPGWSPAKSTFSLSDYSSSFLGVPQGDPNAIPTSQESSGSSGGWLKAGVELFGFFLGAYQGARDNSGSVVIARDPGCDPGINPSLCKQVPGPTGPVQPAANLNSAMILFLIALIGVIILVRR